MRKRIPRMKSSSQFVHARKYLVDGEMPAVEMCVVALQKEYVVCLRALRRISELIAAIGVQVGIKRHIRDIRCSAGKDDKRKAESNSRI